MNHHNAVEDARSVTSMRSLKRRGRFHFARPLWLTAAGIGALAMALVGPGFTRSASAQTMGEYGAITAHSAGAASSMPKVYAPDLGRQTGSDSSNSSDASQGGDVQTYDPPSNDRSNDDKDTSKDDNPHGDWDQVK